MRYSHDSEVFRMNDAIQLIHNFALHFDRLAVCHLIPKKVIVLMILFE